MDDKKNEILLTPENLKDDTIRSSTRRTSISNTREKILPQYLRASTGSCHDFCKYGRTHTFKEKGDGPTRKGMSATPDEARNVGQDATVPIRKKKPTISSNHSSEQKTQVPEIPMITKQVIEVVEHEASSPLKKIDASKEHSSLLPKREKKQLIGSRSSVNPKVKVSDKAKFNETARTSSKETNNSKDEIVMNLKPVAVKSSLHYSQDSDGGRDSGIKKVSTPGKFKIGLKKGGPSPRLAFSSKPSLGRIGSIKPRNYKFPKTASPSKKQNKFIKTNLHDEKKVIEKVLYMIEPKPGDKILDPTENVSNSRLSSLSSSSSTESSPNALVPCLKKDEKLSSGLSSGEENKAAVVGKTYGENKKPVLEHNKTQKKKPIESVKRDYKQKLRRPVTDNGSSRLTKTGNNGQIESVKQESKEKSRRPTTDDSASQRVKAGTKNQIKPLKQELKNRPIKRIETTPKDKDPSLKLNIRRGKMVNAQSENNGPRRLNFRQGRVQDSHNVKSVTRRTFKPIQVVDRGTPKAKSERVTLRRHNVNGKKDTQGLFNIVIEETASKLVELRKSKVKALVGAFETVISLQEGKKTSGTITK
ncbi:hypothetical protein Scep_017126 [Stephania cephalantha]|uniref:Calmodulin-binding domain-containing protein n=1 Tax=Stephania cephalantha TaxID=152367 RepID=A0AAP0NTY2_9MAGN